MNLCTLPPRSLRRDKDHLPNQAQQRYYTFRELGIKFNFPSAGYGDSYVYIGLYSRRAYDLVDI